MTPVDDAEDFVPIWEGPTIEAEHLRLRLEAEYIPVDLGDALLPGHARVEVPRSYLADAGDVIAGKQARWPEITVARRGGGFDVNPFLRLALVVMAGLLIVMIVLLYTR